jgi:DUF4097 and DUF4098 domain-containing protein YvlB
VEARVTGKLTLGCLAVALGLVASGTPAQGQAQDFRWAGAIELGKTVEIKGVNGDIRAEAASGNQVEVVAVKRARRSDPASVDIQVLQHDGNVTICAVYPTPAGSWRGWYRDRRQPNECAPNHGGRMNVKDNDVAVDFVVRLPQGVRLAAHTVNGSIAARSLKSDADVHTVNGRIALSTTGEGSAKSVNGSIEAALGSVSGAAPLEFNTVNGSITLMIPKDANARLRARLVNGHFDSDVPLLVQSFRARPRSVDGVIGKGGQQLDLHTVNGSIHLQFATD